MIDDSNEFDGLLGWFLRVWPRLRRFLLYCTAVGTVLAAVLWLIVWRLLCG